MLSIGRSIVLFLAMLAVMPVGYAVPAEAQESSGEYREALNGLHAEMNALTLEIENYRVSARYCKLPGIPSKAEAQAELDGLARRAEAMNRRYNALKQSLKDFARNPRVAAELMLRDIDPTQDRWFSSYEAARRRMADALARKRAALAAAPEVDCSPKPKPKPAVTTGGGFQAPALPVRPSTSATAWPALPTHFCSFDERLKFLQLFEPFYLKASDDAVAAAKFRSEVEQAVNSYVQNDRPVPPDLIARRRQAIADVEAAARRVQEAEDMRRRVLAIPVIDCRTPVQTEPPRTEPPREDTQTGQATTRELPTWGRGLEAIDEATVATQQRIVDGVEADLKALEDMVRRRAACGAILDEADDIDYGLDELEEEDWFPPSTIREWRSRLDRIMRGCPPPRISIFGYPPAAPSGTGFLPPDPRMRTIFEEHNKARSEVGVPRLQWDPTLAAGASSYAAELARTGQRVHSTREGRGAVRENLNQGMLGWSPGQMVQNWLKEKQNFYPGTYPSVTRTGRWQDVSHYTQMIWPTTTHVGCGLTSGSGYQWLVCRYSPGGNKDGHGVGLPSNRPVIAQDGGIAPPNSSTPILPHPKGGGMTQIDPPPPPPPTARDDAPEGKEENHPLVRYAQAADAQHATETDCSNATLARLELDKMRYALDELKKRLKAARQAGPFSSIKPDEVQRQINDLERRIREAEQRKPRGACPLPPAPQQRGMVNEPGR